MVAGLMALAGCHTCDVCDDCGDGGGYNNHYRGCRSCRGGNGHYAPGYVVPNGAGMYIESKPAVKTPVTTPAARPPVSSSGS
jgi:hypothetical protein